MTPMPSRKKEKIGGPGPGPHADSPPTEGRKEREREREREIVPWNTGGKENMFAGECTYILKAIS